jgi:hypothetical protein
MLHEGVVKIAGRCRVKKVWNELDEEGKGLARRALRNLAARAW